jgi:hypothetical protein
MYDPSEISNFNEATMNAVIHLSSMKPLLGKSTTQMPQTPSVCDAAQLKCYPTRNGYYEKKNPQIPNVQCPAKNADADTI